MARRRVAGRHSVLEALKVRPQEVTHLYIEKGGDHKPWLKKVFFLAKKNRIQTSEQKGSFFKSLCQNAQGIACDVNGEPAWPSEGEGQLFFLALDGVTDPHNFGAILRTAWLMGVDGILLPERESVALSPTVCKVASGGVEHIPIKKVRNLKQEIADLKEKGFWSYALAVDADAQSIKKVVKSEKTILIAGAEEKGIKPSLIKDSDFKVYIPQKDAEASYNVSVSVALGLWALMS